jgi:E3 ubiquitin-protein ligase BAH
MKFGHAFKQSLRNEGFPPEWVDSAISYSQLKKCINRLTDELRQVGLNPETLSKLLKHVEDYNASTADGEDQERPFQYILNGPSSADDASRSSKPFHPKLLVMVIEATGEICCAKLNEETRGKLQMLAFATGMSNLRVSEDTSSSLMSGDSVGLCKPDGASQTATVRTVEIPLTSDTEFFTRLSKEVSGLEKLQVREQKRMHTQIEELGKEIARVTDPDKKHNRKVLAAWRQVFQLYVEEGIFFGNTESDHKSHDSEKAMQRLAEFSNKVARAGVVETLQKKDNIKALNVFMHINREILQSLRFGEINHSAMVKILKSVYPQYDPFQLLTKPQSLINAQHSGSSGPSHDKSNIQSSPSTSPKPSAQKSARRSSATYLKSTITLVPCAWRSNGDP